MNLVVRVTAVGLVGCTGTDATSGDDDDDIRWDGTESGSDPDPGGIAILTGFDAHETAFVAGPSERCGYDPPFVVGDITGDSVAEFALVCRNPEDTYNRDLYVLDGVGLLASTFVQVGLVHAGRSMVSAVGDLDSDGLEDIGFDRSPPPVSGQELALWNVRAGATLVGESGASDGALAIFGEGGEYPSETLFSAGDVDLDGVLDVAVWQEPGSLDPVVSLVSGATLLTGAHVSVLTDALRHVAGLGDLEQPDDLANVGDTDGDGEPDIATVIVDSQARYDSERTIAVTVFSDASLVEPAMRIEMAPAGRIRHGQLEALGDLDGDGRVELAALLSTFSSSEEHHAEMVVIPGAVLAVGGDVASSSFALGGDTFSYPQFLDVCDLDGDGLSEIVSDLGIWDGRDLLTPGALPVGPGVFRATCAGDLDGVPGSELVQGPPFTHEAY